MKKPNETRFKHNFVIAAVLAVFLLATGCPNTNKPGGTDKPQGGTDTETPKTPDQTTPDTSSTEGETSGSETGETEEEGDKTVKLTIKDLKEAVDGYEPTKEAAFIKGKVLKGVGKDDDAAIAKLKAKVAKELVKLNASTEYQYKLFNKDGGTIADTDYADDGVLTIGKKSLSAVKIKIIDLSSATADGYDATSLPVFDTGAGKMVKAYAPSSADAAAKQKALKEAVAKFLKEKNASDKKYDYALFSANNGGAIADTHYKDDGTGVLFIGRKGKLGKVKIIVKKISSSTQVQLTSGGKKLDPLTNDDIDDAVFAGVIEAEDIDLSDASNSISKGLKAAIEEKIGVEIKDNTASSGEFVVVSKGNPDPSSDTNTIILDPETALKNGDTVYITKIGT